jgi:hypothetical protein
MNRNSIFGWSYPPGCSGPPADDEPPISPQSEEVCLLLEEAECEQELIDKVVKIVDDLAFLAANCPECEKRSAEAEIKFYEEFKTIKG